MSLGEKLRRFQTFRKPTEVLRFPVTFLTRVGLLEGGGREMKHVAEKGNGQARVLDERELTCVWGGTHQKAVIRLQGYEEPYLHINEQENGYTVDTNIESSQVTRKGNLINVIIS